MPAASSTRTAYKVSGGLHGVGVSVVNALSDWLDLRIWRDGTEHFVRFERGETVAPLKVVGPAEGRRGTQVTFLASTDTFTNLDYSFKTLEHRLRELAFLNSGVGSRCATSATPRSRRASSPTRAASRVRPLSRPVEVAADQAADPHHGERDGIGVEAAMWWNDSYHETMLPFTNNIPQRDGGTHLAGFRGALTRTINAYVATSGLAKKEKVTLSARTCARG
jgi:DNA gyrase subunit B